MKNLFFSICIGLLCTSFTVVPTELLNKVQFISPAKPSPVAAKTEEASSVYYNVNLQQYGLSKEVFDYAWKGYQLLVERKKISRTDYLTICDFSQSSRQKRLYVIDIYNCKLVTNTWVAHGRNSGTDYATKFSNTPESLQSSLGFFITSQTYTGEHGLSLRINGVEPGYNDKAMTRSIVIHGATYVDGARAKAGVMMGRSFGCPSVPAKESAAIITTIKNGTCLFIYHPSKNYLLGSKILNG